MDWLGSDRCGGIRAFGGLVFDVVEAGKAIVVLFDDGRIDELFPIRVGRRLRHGPSGLGRLGTLQDEHGGARLDGR
jgi:hypothetical protein